MSVAQDSVKINLLLMLGAENVLAASPIETILASLLDLAARTTLQTAQNSFSFSRLIALTNSPDFEPPPGVELRGDKISSQPFHFGQALQAVAATLPPNQALLYIGAGAGLLLNQEDWAGLERVLHSEPNVATANNFFSADLVGWQPIQALSALPPALLPLSDNNLAWVLVHRAGLNWRPILPENRRSLGMQFDIDTPADAAILKRWLAQNLSRATHLVQINQFLAQASLLEAVPVKPIVAALSSTISEVLVCGRISAGLHRMLEMRASSQTRILSEERGMRADGREARGEVNSLAGFLLEELGPRRFFEKLARSADAAIIDSRVLFAHLKRRPNRADRFNSDIFQPDFIGDPVLKAFTEAAIEARERWNFPVLLGGHSAVAGSLLLLLDLVE